MVPGAAAVEDGVVYIASCGRSIYALDANPSPPRACYN